MSRVGQIRWADLSPTVGSEQAGHRPVVVLVDGLPGLVIVAPLSHTDRGWVQHVVLEPAPGQRASVVMCEQVRSMSSTRLGDVLGEVTAYELARIRQVLARLFNISARTVSSP